ncbi:uncharacterized protein SCDLUD_000220 [Saccharomycodes ludwigii]|uniref:uncharacterized protein n=1 Tax=Saccharomycodes ludwigii TaxID=36035 RepID=UPI001E825F80|nr:hypothetical protein SCDLUD_000220 [Saccharomycodes ludwigii]KAH3902639.1 hypothetical protein SCDLUD_000220 [Saccharomycodes ludwigii]
MLNTIYPDGITPNNASLSNAVINTNPYTFQSILPPPPPSLPSYICNPTGEVGYILQKQLLNKSCINNYNEKLLSINEENYVIKKENNIYGLYNNGTKNNDIADHTLCVNDQCNATPDIKINKNIISNPYQNRPTRCWCKRKNIGRLASKPKNAFILFRQKFQRLLRQQQLLDITTNATNNKTAPYILSGTSNIKPISETELKNICINSLQELREISNTSLLSQSESNELTTQYINGIPQPKFQTSMVSKFASDIWKSMNVNTKQYWYDLAHEEKRLYNMRINNKRKNFAVKSRTLNDNNSGEDDADIYFNDKLELCDFCQLRLEKEPGVTRSMFWNKKYVKLSTYSIDLVKLNNIYNVPYTIWYSENINGSLLTDYLNEG